MRQRSAAAMPYVKDDYDIALHGEQDAVAVLPASIEQLPYLIRKVFVLRRERAARGNSESEAIASCIRRNQRKPVSPAPCARSQAKMSRASCFACAEGSTRKAMLYAQIFNELL